MKNAFSSFPAAALRSLRGAPVRALTALCIGFGCAWPLLLAMGLAPSAPLCALCCTAVALVFAPGEGRPLLRVPGILMVLLALAALLAAYRDQQQSLLRAFALFVNGQPLALAAYSRALTVLLALFFSCLGAVLARSELALFPLALLTAGVLLVVSLAGVSLSPLALLPLPAALLLCCRARSVRFAQLLPMAALVLALTLLCAPLAGRTQPPLSALAARVQQAINDYLFFTSPRTAFTLASTGYQPLGQAQLGGTASPTDDPVMLVKTPGRALLRAAIRNEYTGLAWADTASGRRYLWVSPRFAALRRDLFDQARPQQALLSLLPAARTLDVTLYADSTSTLFLTQRFLSPRGEGIVSYFSPSSEVFATRSLRAGSHYSFSGRLMDASTPGIRQGVLAAYDGSDPYADTVRSLYLGLPAAVEPEVFEIAMNLTAGAGNDFDRAAALCRYLQRSFPYSLTQNTPPVTRDFVSWFLLSEKRGYCTSFASALTVLVRAAGLPARYVEGYVAEPDSDGIARVTQRGAHAWTEIYFPGFGWLPFDPTPGIGLAPDTGSDHAPDESDPDDSGDPDEPEVPDDPDADPDGTPTPSPTPSPSPTAEPTPSPSPTPEHHDPSVTPTPPITPTPPATPAPTPSPASPPDSPPDSDGPSPLPWLLLLVLLAALTALRLALVSPARLAAHEKGAGNQLTLWYLAVRQALCVLGVPQQEGEAPASYLLRAQDALGHRVSLTRLGELLCVASYSAHRLKPAAVQKGERAYRAVYALLTPWQRLRLHARRFVQGIRPE